MRYDVITPRPRKDGKTYWHKIGAGFPKDGGKINVTLDSLPISDSEGRVSLMLVEAKPREDKPQGMYSDRGTAPADDRDGDIVPF